MIKTNVDIDKRDYASSKSLLYLNLFSVLPIVWCGECHGAGLCATILSSGVDVLAVPRVSVKFRCASRNEGALSRR